MYAVIKTGGKQHKVKAGDVIEVELLRSDGDTVTFTPLLVVDDEGSTHFGKDASKAVVTAKLVGEQKGEKVKILKYRQKTGYTRRAGHRQMYTLIEIQDVSLGGARAKPAAKPKATKAAKPAAPKASAPDAEPEGSKDDDAKAAGSARAAKGAEVTAEAEAAPDATAEADA